MLLACYVFHAKYGNIFYDKFSYAQSILNINNFFQKLINSK